MFLELLRLYNPLFIYGGAGQGKTDLMHAIGNAALANEPTKVVRYVHAEDFDSVKLNYRALDLLLLDDVQFLKGKDRSQEALYNLFSALIEDKKHIVISCDTEPNAIEGLEDRLITCMGSGLVIQVDSPETEIRSPC